MTPEQKTRLLSLKIKYFCRQYAGVEPFDYSFINTAGETLLAMIA